MVRHTNLRFLMLITAASYGIACATVNTLYAAAPALHPIAASSPCAKTGLTDRIVRLRNNGPNTFKDFQKAFNQFLNLLTVSRSDLGSLNSLSPTLVSMGNRSPGVLDDFLTHSPLVLSQEPNAEVSLMRTPADGDFGAQCGLKAIHAESAWDYASPDNASNVRVAIVDSGIAEHRDLCDNLRFAETDEYGHGTHIAGIVGASEGNGGVVGVVWNADLFGFRFTDRNGVGNLGCAIAKLDDALTFKDAAGSLSPHIVVLAWGTRSDSAILRDTIRNHPGVLFVAAAGNFAGKLEDALIYPASFHEPNLITVMATACDDTVAPFTSYSETLVDLAAPGAAAPSAVACADSCHTSPHGILSTVLNHLYCCEKGTSMSAGFVAGAAALVLSQHPGFKPDQIKRCLVDSAERLDALNGLCASSGRLDLRRAVDPFLRPASCQ